MHGMPFVRLAFFAGKDIPALTDLTWDYEMVKPQDGRHHPCHCGAATCRGRLY